MVTLPVCRHRGREVEGPAPGNGNLGVVECASTHFVQGGFVAALTCLRCTFADLPNDATAPTPEIAPAIKRAITVMKGTACSRRGTALETGVWNICGTMKGRPFEIFACELHGKCMVRRFRNDRPDLKVCMNCDDFVPLEPHSTSEP